MSKKKTKRIFTSPIDWSKPDCSYFPSNYEKGTLKTIIERYPEIFLDEDIYIDEELTTLWKEKYREKRLNKLLEK